MKKMNLSIIHLDQHIFQWGGQQTPPREMSVCQYAECKVAYVQGQAVRSDSFRECMLSGGVSKLLCHLQWPLVGSCQIIPFSSTGLGVQVPQVTQMIINRLQHNCRFIQWSFGMTLFSMFQCDKEAEHDLSLNNQIWTGTLGKSRWNVAKICNVRVRRTL